MDRLRGHASEDFSGGWGNDFYHLSHVLRDIPRDMGIELLVKHWEHLQFSPLFIQLALYLCAPETLEMAKASINRCGDKRPLFKHIDMFFGFMTSGRSEKLTLAHLSALLPWLEYCSDLSVRTLADFCVQNGFMKWAETNVEPEFNRRSQSATEPVPGQIPPAIGKSSRFFPREEDLIKELDLIEADTRGHKLGAIHVWINNFSRRPVSQGALWDALDSWFQKSPNTGRLSVVAQAIELAGNRDQLALLTKYKIDRDPERVEELISNATFVVKSRTLN